MLFGGHHSPIQAPLRALPWRYAYRSDQSPFLFEAQGVNNVCAGPMIWTLEDALYVMKWYREFITQAPEEMNGFFAMMSVPPGPPSPRSCTCAKCAGLGGAIRVRWRRRMRFWNRFEITARRLRILRADAVSDAPGYVRWHLPQRSAMVLEADFFRELGDAAIEKHVEHAALLPSWQSTMHLYPVNGKVNRVGESETAFSYRDAVWSEVIVGVDPDPANCGKITDWARSYYDALHPFGAGGAYVNFMMEEGEDRLGYLPRKLQPAFGDQSEV